MLLVNDNVKVINNTSVVASVMANATTTTASAAATTTSNNSFVATTCNNDYCVSDDDYVELLKNYIFPTNFEWVLVVFYVLVFVIGLVGNFLVCFVVWKNHHMRTVTNLFIFNLSTADLLVIIVCLPPTVLGDVTETWYMGQVLCKIVHYLQSVSVSVSVLTLTVISIERFYAICHPLKFRSTKRRARIMILLIWIASLVILAPELVVLDVHPHHSTTILLTTCKPRWAYQATYQLFISVAMFFIPLALMAFAYFRIAATLWNNVIPAETRDGRSREMNTSSTTGRPSDVMNQVMARRNVAKMLIAVVWMFGICYFPVHMLNVVRYAKLGMALQDDSAIHFALIAHWLCYFNSAINPVIYNFMSAKFRLEFKDACRCCCCCCCRVSPRLGHVSRQSGHSYNSYKYGNSVVTQTENITMNSVVNASRYTNTSEYD